ncbi:unnamed protein product, partial [Polarella glacialis]
MIDAILHTDPSRYETVVEQVRALCDQGVTTLNIDSNCQTEVRQALTRALLITGDLSHQMRTCETANAWASLLQSELCLQGDREKELGLPVAPIRDRSRQPHRADFQLYLGWSRIAPLLGAQVWFFPTLEPAASQLKDNASSWAKELQSSGFESQVEQASLNPGAGRAKQICVLLDASRPYPLVKGNGESRSGQDESPCSQNRKVLGQARRPSDQGSKGSNESASTAASLHKPGNPPSRPPAMVREVRRWQEEKMTPVSPMSPSQMP